MCCYQQCNQDSFHSTTESQALEGTSRAPLKAKALLQTARENTQVGFEYLQRTLCHLPGQFELCRSQSLPGTPPAPLRAHRPPSRRWAPPKGARRHPSDPPPSFPSPPMATSVGTPAFLPPNFPPGPVPARGWMVSMMMSVISLRPRCWCRMAALSPGPFPSKQAGTAPLLSAAISGAA